MAAIVVAASTAAAPPASSGVTRPGTTATLCDGVPYRAWDDAANVTVARGVYGILKTPELREVSGLTGSFSGADIALLEPGGGVDFVQTGWYLGQTGNLDAVSTPHVFVGEWTGPWPDDEYLRTGSPLQWDTYYTFSIWRHEEAGTVDDFYFFLNGVFRTSTIDLHNRYNLARFLGESNDRCTVMAAYAYGTSSPLSTLQYLVDKPGGAVQWYLFWDVDRQDPPFYMVQVIDRATGHGYGP